jgi:hypothetical protein
MGFAITWFAVPEKNSEEFLKRLQLTPTGESEEELPESLIATANLSTGWTLLWYNKYDCPFLGEPELKSISMNHDVIRCLVEEHVMACSSELWSGGKRKWFLSHEGENGPKGLDAEGVLPESFPDIRTKMEAAQLAEGGDKADVDLIFEIPLKVAQTMVGFKHDERCAVIRENQFYVLARTAPEAGFFGKLFGKK